METPCWKGRQWDPESVVLGEYAERNVHDRLLRAWLWFQDSVFFSICLDHLRLPLR